MVYVLDKKKKPLMPCLEKRARPLPESGRARVQRGDGYSYHLISSVQDFNRKEPASAPA
jgi:hypothetical protein